MKNLLIIYPHWYPCNLAGVHRPRLLGNFLSEFGWNPIILTVKPEYFEEEPDSDFHLTFSSEFKEYRVNSLRTKRNLIPIGDIGLRAFLHLYKGAKKIIAEQKIDFIFIPIPSFYVALLGRMIYSKTKIPYGIDYIDPWVRDISTRKNLKSRLSIWIAKFLEPIAVKHASLISGVSQAYYQPVLERNFKNKQIHEVAMPYGFDPHDHQIKLPNLKPLLENSKHTKIIIYAGAFLPKSHYFIKSLFKAISNLTKTKQISSNFKLYFLGTGSYTGKNIEEYAAEYSISDIVFEYRNRLPFLQIINHLSNSFGVLVIGSTEKHYTASKIFQAILSGKPVFAMLHQESSAIQILAEAQANQFTIAYAEDITEAEFDKNTQNYFLQFLENTQWKPNFNALEPFSARNSAKKLAEKLNIICK